MDGTDFSAHRVLVVGGKTHAIQLLRSVLGIAGIGKIIYVQEARYALELLGREAFSAVFYDHGLDEAGDRPFIVAARRGDMLLNPMIPIFALQERARRRDVEKARDTGVTDVLTMPISPRTLRTKLRTATQTPRPFIVANEYFGPDRRARARTTHFGPDRRTRSPKKAKVDFTQL